VTYGAVHGIPLGARFLNRRSLYDARIHRDIRRGICGGPDKKRGAESVVLSGGHEDDRDLGQIVYYTGIGKRDSSGRLTADQEFGGLNRSLAVNAQTAQPIRLIRGVSGEFEYSGLFIVEDAFLRPGASGFQICQYRLRSLQSAGESDSGDIKQAEAKRVLTTHYRLVRDAGVPTRVKVLYGYRCQVCDIRIDTLAGPYSEGAHLVPLGGGADGPDIDANVLSLCPNHHVMLDHGAICFTDDWTVLDRRGNELGSLNVHPDHRLQVAFARTHRRLMGFDELLVPAVTPMMRDGVEQRP
jgi:putative restriction endonuclease